MKFAFSTLACPQWDWETVMRQALTYGYGGIEMRGLKGELDIEKLAPFQENRIKNTIAQLKQTGLFLPCIDTSCTFLGDDEPLDTLRSGLTAIELAARLGSPYIRVFGDVVPQGMQKGDAVVQVSDGLQQLGTHARNYGVTVLLETHGSFVDSSLLLKVFERIDSPAVGLLWDSANTFEAGEAVEFTWSKIKHLVRHVHMKDFAFQQGTLVPCLPGCGEVPLGKIINLLMNSGYSGWLSFEWEKRWCPAIESPEIALPAFVKICKEIAQ